MFHEQIEIMTKILFNNYDNFSPLPPIFHPRKVNVSNKSLK